MDARATEFGTADAKAHFSELLARVEGGETITIRRHGKVVAKMVPATPMLTSGEKLSRIENYLAWRDREGPALPPGLSTKELIDEGRH